MRIWLFLCLFVLGSLFSYPSIAQVQIRPVGAQQTVFSHARDACRPEDIPDAPARAFRDSTGLVHLFTTHYFNYAFLGPSLNSMKRDCRIVYHGAGEDDPSQFNDRAWLASFWTDDGHTVQALVHNEFQGNLRPTLCPSLVYFNCWYNAVTAAMSYDGGYHFVRPTNPIVAAPSEKFAGNFGHPVGYFAPTNIVEYGGYYYTMVWAGQLGRQRPGVCLLRTQDPAHAETWRAWDGAQFGARLRKSLP